MDQSFSWPIWLRVLGVHQDYLWFAALLAWSLALVAWWWHPRRDGAWRWLPWFAGSAIATAVVQFGIFNPPFDFFHDRLRAGTLFDYDVALIDAALLGDFLCGIALAVPSVGIWYVGRGVARRGFVRVVAVGTILAAGVARFVFPGVGWILLFGASVAGAVAWWRRVSPARAASRALFAAVTLPLFSVIGGIAAVSGTMLGDGPPTPVGAIAGAAHGVAGVVVLLAVLPGVPVLARRGAAVAGQPWPALLVAIAWLAGGLWFAHQTGVDNREELLQNRLRLTAARAATFDRRFLSGWNGGGMVMGAAADAAKHREATTAVLPELERGAGRVLALQMIEERDATIYVEQARLIAVSDGWLIALASSHPQHAPGTVELIRPATAGDVSSWIAQENVVETSPAHEIGEPYYCRAPIVAPDGTMLAWLEFKRSEFFQSIERKWRSGPLLLTALGLVLGATLQLQRRAAQEREAALRLAAAQAAANQMKSVFLAKVSHELRTPIQSLLGYSELLRRELDGRPLAQAWLNSLQEHGELMTRLVNDLIDLGALDAGTFRLAPRATRLGELVQRTVESFRPRAEAKGLRLTCRIDLGETEWVSVDAERVRQVIINLVGNAVKFTAAGGVDVAARVVSPADPSPLVELEVRDTGPGVAPGDQRRIFAAFTRLDGTSAHEGTGLGLALTSALCQAMGGSVRVESDGRPGSVFRATFRAPGSGPVAEKVAAAAPNFTGLRVLVVDDHPLVRELFVASLAASGASCTAVGSAGEAMREAAAPAPDAAVIDLGLPDLDGAELARRLRGVSARIRIVGVSAHAGAEDRERALAAGMDEFLVKPVSIATLVAAVAGEGRAAGADDASALRERLFAAFREDLPARREALRAAAQSDDRQALRRAAHYLANSAAAIDDAALLEACLRVEDACSGAFPPEERRERWQHCDELLAGYEADGRAGDRRHCVTSKNQPGR